MDTLKKDTKDDYGKNIPEYQYEALARILLPKMQKYFESEEGKQDLENYRAEKIKQIMKEKQ